MRKLGVFIVVFLAVGYASAQSLKVESPYPIQQGINKGTADSLVGTNYWYFYATPGNNKLTVRFTKPISLYGAPIANTALTITLTDEKKTWHVTKVVSPGPNKTDAMFTSEKLKSKTKIIVSVAPPNQNMIRAGGDYEIEATGDVEFDSIKSGTDPIVRTFESKVGYGDESYGTVKFNADGTVETSNGYKGTWKSFDRENRIYTVVVGHYKVSAQYLPGYGLVKPDEPNMILFQELRR